jgi:hypothetical protein
MMKRIILLPLLIVTVTMHGCLTYKTVKYEIKFNEDFKSGIMRVTYFDLRSSEEDPQKQENDFNELVRLTKEDDFLLDSMEDGVYVKERKFSAQDGKIVGTYSGIFRNLKIDSEELKESENERSITLDKDENDIIETNGKVMESKDKFIITWAKDVRNLDIKITKMYDAQTYSLMDYYTAWQNK